MLGFAGGYRWDCSVFVSKEEMHFPFPELARF